MKNKYIDFFVFYINILVNYTDNFFLSIKDHMNG